MTQDEILRMARMTELVSWLSTDRGQSGRWWIDAHEPGEELRRFAELVAAKEREACAKVCESLPLEWKDQPIHAQTEKATMIDCAFAIRARGLK